MSKYDSLYPKKQKRVAEMEMIAEYDDRPHSVRQYEAATAQEEEKYAREIERLQRAIEEMQPVEDPFSNGTVLLIGAVTNPVVFTKDEDGVWHSQGYVKTWRSVLSVIRQYEEVRMVLSYRTLPGGEIVEVERKRQARKATAKKAAATPTGRKPMTEATKKAAAAKRAATIAAKKAESTES